MCQYHENEEEWHCTGVLRPAVDLEIAETNSHEFATAWFDLKPQKSEMYSAVKKVFAADPQHSPLHS